MQFGPFDLDPMSRRLSRGGEAIDLNARYLDVLILLVEAAGDLVSKDRFMDEVWRGVPVTDEALTQAIRTLRRALGDSATVPRFIETVPKHGYRFIAAIAVADAAQTPTVSDVGATRLSFIQMTLAGTSGAMIAGALVGLIYGFIGAAQYSGGGGAVSLLLVLVLISSASAGVAGAGIAAGIAVSQFISPPRLSWTVAGGALGGMILGAFANLIGRDAFRLLFGQEVGRFAGATEGLILGAVIGIAAWIARRRSRRALGAAGLLGATAALGVALLGGRMMAGSLESLVIAFPASQFRLAGIGVAAERDQLDPIAHAITAAFEGAVFTMAMAWSSRSALGENYRRIEFSYATGREVRIR